MIISYNMLFRTSVISTNFTMTIPVFIFLQEIRTGYTISGRIWFLSCDSFGDLYEEEKRQECHGILSLKVIYISFGRIPSFITINLLVGR